MTAERLTLGGLLLFTLLVRGGVLWVMRGNLQQDPDAYREIAENLLRHGEFALGKPAGTGAGEDVTPTAYRPPLYPVVLSNLPTADGQQVSLAKVAALHLALGVATVWLTWLTAHRVGSAHRGDDAAGIARPTIAGLIVACDPILLNQQTLVMTETLAAFLAILSLWCLARFDASRSWFNAALAGGAIGLAALCRPTFLPWLGLVGSAMLVMRGRTESGKRKAESRAHNFRSQSDFGWRLSNLAGLIAVAAAVMAPWVIRNYRVFGKPMVTTTHGGYTLFLGNNGEFYDYLEHDDLSLPFTPLENGRQLFDAVMAQPEMVEAQELGIVRRHLSTLEITIDDANYGAARLTITDRPRSFVKACVYRIIQLWSPLPHKLTADESMRRRLLRYATCAWYCGVYAMAVMGIWRIALARGTPQRAFPAALLQPPWIWGVLLCCAFTAVHTFYWTNLRMRAPLMPFVAIVAGAAIAGSKFKVQSSKSQMQEGGDGTRSVPTT